MSSVHLTPPSLPLWAAPCSTRCHCYNENVAPDIINYPSPRWSRSSARNKQIIRLHHRAFSTPGLLNLGVIGSIFSNWSTEYNVLSLITACLVLCTMKHWLKHLRILSSGDISFCFEYDNEGLDWWDCEGT